jgi:predicted PurR-regulated permease PerM
MPGRIDPMTEEAEGKRAADIEAAAGADERGGEADAGEEGRPTSSEEVTPSGEPQEPSQARPVFLGLSRRVLWGLGVLGVLAALVALASAVRSVTVPLLVAFVIAYLLDPVVDRFEARGIGRTPAIIVLLGTFLLVGGLVVLLLVPQVVTEFAQVPEKLGLLLTRAEDALQHEMGVTLPSSFREALTAALNQLEATKITGLAAPLGHVLRTFFGGTVSLLASLAGLLMIPVFAFYLLRDFDRIVAHVHDLLPAGYREPIAARFREIDETMGLFVRGQLTVAGLLALLYTLGFWIVGLPLATLVGIVAGIGNIVPYLGTGLGVTLATALALLDWHGVGHLLAVYAVFVVVQGLEGWVITPKIVGESVGLSPFVVIVAVLVFGDLFGFFGVLVAVPLAAILKILLRVALEAYRDSEFYRGH